LPPARPSLIVVPVGCIRRLSGLFLILASPAGDPDSERMAKREQVSSGQIVRAPVLAVASSVAFERFSGEGYGYPRPAAERAWSLNRISDRENRQKSLKPSGACERRQLSKLQRRKEIAWKDVEISREELFAMVWERVPLKKVARELGVSRRGRWQASARARLQVSEAATRAIGPGCSQGRLPPTSRRFDAFRDHDACSYERIERGAGARGNGAGFFQWGK